MGLTNVKPHHITSATLKWPTISKKTWRKPSTEMALYLSSWPLSKIDRENYRNEIIQGNTHHQPHQHLKTLYTCHVQTEIYDMQHYLIKIFHVLDRCLCVRKMWLSFNIGLCLMAISYRKSFPMFICMTFSSATYTSRIKDKFWFCCHIMSGNCQAGAGLAGILYTAKPTLSSLILFLMRLI